MKISVIGGAGARTPLLVQGISRSDLPVTEVSLYDLDQERLRVIGRLAADMASPVEVKLCAVPSECIEGSDYVFTSIRVGGIERRARDEAVILSHNLIGQETVGAGGFAMALRTIPPMLRYAKQIADLAPRAWIINFTNPVSIITQAVRKVPGARVIGICDTPTELFEQVAEALGVNSKECFFDYFGLNHLGWIREVLYRGQTVMERCWREIDSPAGIYRTPLFENRFLRKLRMLPTEYLYYYYRPEVALRNILKAGISRGKVIQELNERLFRDLAQPGADRVRVYQDYLNARDAGYMQIESGTEQEVHRHAWADLTGYDRIAMSVVRAIYTNSSEIIPLNVSNQGNFPFLDDEDVVEVPCVVNCNGARPLHVEPVPAEVRELIREVKAYERLTIEAAESGRAEDACRALSSNPLVANTKVAESLLMDLELL